MKIAYFLLAIVLICSCAAQTIGPPGEISESNRVELTISNKIVQINLPANVRADDLSNIPVIMRDDLVPDNPGKVAGAWYPIQLRFDSSLSGDTNRADFRIWVGAMHKKMLNRNLLTVSPRILLEEKQLRFWMLVDDASSVARRLHKENYHLFDLYDAPSGLTWVRHLSEGLLDTIWDNYSVPINEDIFLQIQFLYARDRWKNDPQWFADRELLGKSIIDSVVVRPAD